MEEHPTPVTVHGRRGLLAAVPFVLGFRPAASLVLLTITLSPGAARVVSAMRVDIDAPWAQVRGRLLPRLRAERCGLVVAGYCGPQEEQRVRDVVADLRRASVVVLDAYVVDGDVATGIPVDRQAPWACGVPGPDDPQVVELGMAMALRGRGVLGDRSAVVRSVAAPEGGRARAGSGATDRAAGRLLDVLAGAAAGGADCLLREIDRAADSARQDWDARRTVDVDLAADLAVLVWDPVARDRLLGRLLRAEAQPWIPVLVSVVTAIPDPQAAAIVATLAVAAYRHGDGALSTVCVDRCLQADPGHRLAQLLRAAAAAGLPPDDLGLLGRTSSDLNAGTTG
ncbi:DUF4192 domain-containing protein [Nakamurella endophytica]|uniref:DUF4192 domain-containing protein n=1 Tax=Nakamurella endophytica TaxID=1748367 RepID=UPI00166C3236|nr:DUF4192 domain-containing protein [Nakamurella endophytica]